MNWLRNLLLRWLGVYELDARVRDLERHFVTKRDPQTGEATETLADVPLKDRKPKEFRMRGMSIQQRREWLERTDGGRVV